LNELEALASEPPTLEEWQRAEAVVNPQSSFVLWAIKTQFCTRKSDFRHHFGDQLPIDALLHKLELQGFVQSDGADYALTSAGEEVVSRLGEPETRENLDRHGPGLKRVEDDRRHEIAQARNEREARTGSEAGPQLRQRHAGQGAPAASPEARRGLFKRRIELAVRRENAASGERQAADEIRERKNHCRSNEHKPQLERRTDAERDRERDSEYRPRQRPRQRQEALDRAAERDTPAHHQPTPGKRERDGDGRAGGCHPQ